jgi:hypothetical protein
LFQRIIFVFSETGSSYIDQADLELIILPHQLPSSWVYSWASPYLTLKGSSTAGHQWLVPVIPATQKAEIKSIQVQSQARQIVCEALSQKRPITKKGWWRP